MRILIFGGSGMAGHMVRDYLQQAASYEIFCTTRDDKTTDLQNIALDVMDEKKVLHTLQQLQPDIVINAVGILNHHAEQNQLEAIYVNSLFPHQLKRWGETMGYRLIHISTDCVFCGEKGGYKEDDTPDGTSIYAKTKALGEIVDDVNLTIRTSIIGPELKTNGIGLFHWFMNQKGTIQGYTNVYWNGITTLELAKVIHWVIQHPITGLIHLTAPEKVSKYDLLHLIKDTYCSKVQIKPCDSIKSDKTLLNTREDFSCIISPYLETIQELHEWMKTQAKNRYTYL